MEGKLFSKLVLITKYILISYLLLFINHKQPYNFELSIVNIEMNNHFQKHISIL